MIRTLASVLLFSALAAAPASAAPADPLVRTVAVQEQLIPMSAAYAAVRRAYPGAEILNGRLVRSAQPYYVIRILTRDGRRRDVRVDARSGRVLS